VIVNGEPLSLGDLSNHTIDSLLDYFKLSSTRVAIEINESVVKKADYDSIILKNDDKIEIIHFVGGGA